MRNQKQLVKLGDHNSTTGRNLAEVEVEPERNRKQAKPWRKQTSMSECQSRLQPGRKPTLNMESSFFIANICQSNWIKCISFLIICWHFVPFIIAHIVTCKPPVVFLPTYTSGLTCSPPKFQQHLAWRGWRFAQVQQQHSPQNWRRISMRSTDSGCSGYFTLFLTLIHFSNLYFITSFYSAWQQLTAAQTRLTHRPYVSDTVLQWQ